MTLRIPHVCVKWDWSFITCPPQKIPTRATLLGREYKLEELRSITMATVDEDHSFQHLVLSQNVFLREKTQKYIGWGIPKCTRFKHVQPCSTMFNQQIPYLLWILAPKTNPSHPTLMLAVAIAISIGFRSLYGDLDLARATPFTSGTRKPWPKNTSIWIVLSRRKIESVYPGKGSVIRLGSQANSLPDGLRSTTIHLDCSLQQNDKTEEFCRLSCLFSSKKKQGTNCRQWPPPVVVEFHSTGFFE